MGKTQHERAIAVLKEKIIYCEHCRKELLKYIEHIKNKCVKREITYKDYSYLLNKKINEKAVHEWIDEYDSCIKSYEKRIRELNRNSTTKKVLLISAGFVILTIMLYSFYVTLTGFSVEETSETSESAPVSESAESIPQSTESIP